MKILYVLLVCSLLSCIQNTSKKKVAEEKIEGKKFSILDASKKLDTISFKKIINCIRTESLPLVDSTNFDSFIDEDDYKNVNAEVLKLKEIYPNFYKEGYNYKAIFNYKLEFSEHFYSVVVTVLKGDNEMESVLINYNLNGEVIDNKIIAYDEIAEGMSRIISKIDKNKLTIDNIFWSEEKQVATEVFEINKEGRINPIVTENTLINSEELIYKAMKELNIDESKTSFVSSKVFSSNPEETIIVIPEMADGYSEDDDVYKLNTHIAIINNKTNTITHRYFESSDTNGWESDAIIISEIVIDTMSYSIAKHIGAFGIQVFFYGMSQPNPYSNKTMSLFIKSDDSLKKIIDNYTVSEYSGEWDTKCAGESTLFENTFNISNEKTNNYFNIIVNSKITETISYVDDFDDCVSKDTVSSKQSVLKFNGEIYDKLQ